MRKIKYISFLIISLEVLLHANAASADHLGCCIDKPMGVVSYCSDLLQRSSYCPDTWKDQVYCRDISDCAAYCNDPIKNFGLCITSTAANNIAANSIQCGPDKSAVCSKTDRKCTADPDCQTPDMLQVSGGIGVCSNSYCYLDPVNFQKYELTPAIAGISLDLQIKKPWLEISIPELTFSEPSKNVDEEGYLHLPWLGEYLTAAYKFAIGIVTIVAVIMIIVQGIRIIVSGGGEEKITGYKKIFQAIIGLVIAWGSYAILYNINPDLVTFNVLKVQYITPEYLPDFKSNPDDAPAETGGFEKTLNVGDIQQYKGKGCGKNLVEIATAYLQQQICQGTNHCANFVSRVLTDSGCEASLKSNGAGDLAKKLSAAGWKLGNGHSGMQAGDIAFWGDPSKLSGGHVGILTGNGGQVIDSGWDMSVCWGSNKNTIQSACGPFYPIGYLGTFPKSGDWATKYSSAYSASDSSASKNWKVREAYAACVAQNGGCAPIRGSNTDSCNYCAKLGQITEFDSSGGNSRQCIDYGKGWDPNTPTKGWDYYLKNPNNAGS